MVHSAVLLLAGTCLLAGIGIGAALLALWQLLRERRRRKLRAKVVSVNGTAITISRGVLIPVGADVTVEFPEVKP